MKKALIIGGIAVFLILVIVLIVVLMKKKTGAPDSVAARSTVSSSSSDAVAPSGIASATEADTHCSPIYPAEQNKKDIKSARSKCGPKLLIPIVGIGYYDRCMKDEKQNMPLICEA